MTDTAKKAVATATEAKKAAVKTVNKAAAKKPVARKAKAAATRAVKKPAARKAAPRKSVLKPSAAKDTLQKIVYGQLGVYALLVDGIKENVGKARKELPGQLNEFVARGKQVEKDLIKAEQDFRKRVRSYNAKAEIEQAADGVKQLVQKFKQRASRAA